MCAANVQVREGREYYIIFINDYSRYSSTDLIAKKYETFGKFEDFQVEVEKQLDKSLE